MPVLQINMIAIADGHQMVSVLDGTSLAKMNIKGGLRGTSKNAGAKLLELPFFVDRPDTKNPRKTVSECHTLVS